MNKFPNYKTVATEFLVPYARNSRTHSAQQVDKIAASIREFGFLNPIIVDGENGIIAGHGRVMAAQKLGLESLPVIEASHLTEAQRRAYVIADNRLALDAGWDNDMLKIELQDLDAEGFDLSLTGFELGELTSLFNEPNFEPGTEDDQGKLDELAPKMIQCPHCGQDFDLREHGQG
jgi:ParB-like chromosome segregation protein Spo0J